MLNKVDLEQFQNAKTGLFAEQMAEHISTHFANNIANIPSNSANTLALVEQAILSAKLQEITGGRYLTLYILVTFLLGLDWDKDPQYAHLYLIWTDLYSSNDTSFSVTLYNATEEYEYLLQVMPNIQEVILEIITTSTGIVHSMYDYYINLLFDKRNFINPVNKKLLITSYEELFDQHFLVEKQSLSEDEWWDEILSDDWKSEKEHLALLTQKKLIYIGLSLCYGICFIKNQSYHLMKEAFSLKEESFTELAAFLRNNIQRLRRA